MSFSEVSHRVFVMTYPVFRVNSILIAGQDRAMLIDTFASASQAARLGEAARGVTGLPLVLVNTHFHFDHAFGNATLAEPDTPVWAHARCVRELAERGEHWKRHYQTELEKDDPQLALEIGEANLLPPNHIVTYESTVDLGGREVVLSHHGRGHTDGDLVVRVEDVLIAGDLVEEGASPDFEDAYPLEWPDTLAELMRLPVTTVIPGHGRPMGRAFLEEQHAELTRLDWLIRDGHADDAPVERVAAASPFTTKFGEPGRYQSTLAVKRGYAQLDGA